MTAVEIILCIHWAVFLYLIVMVVLNYEKNKALENEISSIRLFIPDTNAINRKVMVLEQEVWESVDDIETNNNLLKEEVKLIEEGLKTCLKKNAKKKPVQ